MATDYCKLGNERLREAMAALETGESPAPPGGQDGACRDVSGNPAPPGAPQEATELPSGDRAALERLAEFEKAHPEEAARIRANIRVRLEMTRPRYRKDGQHDLRYGRRHRWRWSLAEVIDRQIGRAERHFKRETWNEGEARRQVTEDLHRELGLMDLELARPKPRPKAPGPQTVEIRLLSPEEAARIEKVKGH